MVRATVMVGGRPVAAADHADEETATAWGWRVVERGRLPATAAVMVEDLDADS